MRSTTIAGNGMSASLTAALEKMHAALALLEEAGEHLAAVRLQHAIDTAEGAKPGEPTAEQLDRFEALFRAPTGS